MPRLIKASLDPGKLRSSAEAARGGYVRPAEKDAARVASEVIQLTGAVMKHPVTDLIVRGVNELVMLGKDDTPGYQDLLEKRKQRLKDRAARIKAGPAPTAVKPRVTPFTDVAPGTTVGKSFDRAAEVEMARARRQPAPAAPPTAMPPQPQPVAEDRGTVLPMMERAMEGKPPIKKAEEPTIEIPRTVEEIMAFVANPIASSEDLDWALTQVAKFAPVLGLDDIGRPKTAYSSAVLEAYAKGQARVPTELDLRKQDVRERLAGLKETQAIDKQTTRKEENVKTAYLQAKQDARAASRDAAILARERRAQRGKTKDIIGDGKAGLDVMFRAAKMLQKGLQTGELTREDLEAIKRYRSEYENLLAKATRRDSYTTKYNKKTKKELGAYFKSLFGNGYGEGLETQKNLAEVNDYITKAITRLSISLAKGEKEFEESKRKEAKAIADAAARDQSIETANTVLGNAEDDLKAAIKRAGGNKKNKLVFANGQYNQEGKGPKNADVKEKYNAYRKALTDLNRLIAGPK